MRPVSLALIAALSIQASRPAAAQDQSKIAILDVQTTGVDPRITPVLTEILTVEVHALHRYEVIAGRDIQAMLGFEHQKELTGCTDATCLAEIGGALGVDHLIASQVGMVGETYVVNIKLINIRKVQVENRIYETVTGKVDTLIGTIRTAVRKLFPERQVASEREQIVTPSEPEAPREPERSPPAADSSARPEMGKQPEVVEKPTLPAAPAPPAATETRTVTQTHAAAEMTDSKGVGALPVVLWSAGGAGLVVGTIFAVVTKQHQANANDEEFVGGQVEIEKAKSSRIIASVALGIGAASAAAGFFVWLSSGRDDSSRRLSLLPIGNAGEYGLAMTLDF